MGVAGCAFIRCLRQPADPSPGRDAPGTGTAVSDQKAPRAEPVILCRSCLNGITRPDERFSFQGSHLHTFANPHGLVFEIGCFRQAPGCVSIGPASDEFTWFAGYSWRVCICAACHVHLGWLFTPPAGEPFHGLIIARLIEPSI